MCSQSGGIAGKVRVDNFHMFVGKALSCILFDTGMVFILNAGICCAIGILPAITGDNYWLGEMNSATSLMCII